MIKKVIFLLLTLTPMFSMAQNFIQTIDGKCYWTDDPIEKGGNVAVKNDGMKISRVSVKDIVLVENMEQGIEILQPDKLKLVEALPFDGNVESFCAAGKRIYIPIASTEEEKRWGAKQLSELLLKDGHWQVVGSKEQADFIVEYAFDTKGRDKAYLQLTDRMGNRILRSRPVKAHGWTPQSTGSESAQLLYDNYLRDEFYQNKLKNWVNADCALSEDWFANVGICGIAADNSGYGIDGMITHKKKQSNVAYGFGIKYNRLFCEDGEKYKLSALVPYVHLTYYVTKHWNPTYFRCKLGSAISRTYHGTNYNAYPPTAFEDKICGLDFSILYGRQWHRLSFEGGAGLYKTKQLENGGGIASSKPFFTLQLNYKIPITDQAKANLRKHLKGKEKTE